MKHLFYCHDINFGAGILSTEESRHCIRSLRLGAGDEIYLTNGAGILYKAMITRPDPGKCEYKITEQVESEAQRSPGLHMAVALTRNISRFEWFLEKATEIGVNEITPMICSKSERNTANMNRLQGILISAIKQSQRVWLPRLNHPESFNSIVEKTTGHTGYIAWLGDRKAPQLKDVYNKGDHAVILIGPEGDFTPEEVQLSLGRGLKPVMLGQFRLRTETAALVAVLTFNLLNQ
jgi:16S rRNA (uracil1498-N3)-methyltransferase